MDLNSCSYQSCKEHITAPSTNSMKIKCLLFVSFIRIISLSTKEKIKTYALKENAGIGNQHRSKGPGNISHSSASSISKKGRNHIQKLQEKRRREEEKQIHVEYYGAEILSFSEGCAETTFMNTERLWRTGIWRIGSEKL